MEENEMKLVLQDVRKAYRLIADYQQRIVELLDFIKTELGAEHYYHYQPHSYSSQSIYKIYNDENVGWNFLPMTKMCLLWHKTKSGTYDWQNNIQQNDLGFAVEIRSDEKPNDEASVEDSHSELQIFVYRCIKYTRRNNWYVDVWDKFTYPDFGEVVEVKNGDGIEYQIYGEKLDLSELDSQEKVLEKLNTFRERASEKLRTKI